MEGMDVVQYIIFQTKSVDRRDTVLCKIVMEQTNDKLQMFGKVQKFDESLTKPMISIYFLCTVFCNT